MKTSIEIRNEFIKYFTDKGHSFVKSSPVIPIDDPTLLFINAGMNQFKDIFLGKKEPDCLRAVNSQKCIRAGGKHNDLEEVGKDGLHHTFFEMLGNWSFGDYYKKEAIIWAWDLLTNVWGIKKSQLYATVHEKDDEAFNLWKQETDIDSGHIQKHGNKDNFWEMGETGPCGPCSEIHIDLGADRCDCDTEHECKVNGKCNRFIELWNLVFIQKFRDDQDQLSPLKNRFVDTGAGLERICQVLQEKKSNYETDLFSPIIKAINELAPDSAGQKSKTGASAHLVIADHIRTLCVAIADGGFPSNEGRGYVLRRILRRAARYGRLLGLNEPFLYKLTPAVSSSLGSIFTEIAEKEAYVKTIIKDEEDRFNKTLDRGLMIFEEILARTNEEEIAGKDVFLLYDTYGFPPDLTAILAAENNKTIDAGGYFLEMNTQREIARKHSSFKMDSSEDNWTILNDIPAKLERIEKSQTECKILKYELLPDNMLKFVLSETPFYAESGGQIADKGKLLNNYSTEIEVLDVKKAGDNIVHWGKLIKGIVENTEYTAIINSEFRLAVERNHTATHLLHSALKEVFGDYIQQKGSMVANDRLRFDFVHFSAVTQEQLYLIEYKVNKEVRKCTPLLIAEKNIAEAKNEGATALFGEKYGDTVRTVKIGDFSHELCGGTHLRYTGEIGLFKIVSETASASGIRRIEAITGTFAENYIMGLEKDIRNLASIVNVPVDQLTDKIIKLEEDNRNMHKEIEALSLQSSQSELEDLMKNSTQIDDFIVIKGLVSTKDNNTLRQLGDSIKSSLNKGIGVLVAVIDGKVSILVVVSKNLSSQIKAGSIVSKLAPIVDGKGGGRPDMAMAGGKNTAKVEDLLLAVENIIQEELNG